MAIKLLVSKVIETNFYVTLDADLLLLRQFTYSDIVSSTNISARHSDRVNSTGNNHQKYPQQRGIFNPEPRNVHPEWWLGSLHLLRGSLVDTQYEQKGN